MSVDKHDSEQLQQYLSGKMSQQERHAFERKALDDPFLQEALEGAETIDAGTFASDVSQLQNQIISSKKSFIWWRVAAVGALFVLGGWFVWDTIDNEPEQQLTKTEETAEDNEPVIADTLEVEEVIPEESEIKVLQPVARTEPNPEPEAKKEGAGAIAAKPVAVQSIPEPSEVFAVADAEMEMDEISEMAAEEEAADKFEKALKGKVSGVAARSQAKKASPAASSKSWFQVAQAPYRKVSGEVTDGFGEGLPGVNVVVKGTTTGVTTDLDGKFELAVPDNSALVFSSVGMETKEVAVGQQVVLDVYLESDSKALQEVVVTGYATQRKMSPVTRPSSDTTNVNVSGYGDFDNDAEGYVEAMPAFGHTEFKKYLEEELFYPEQAISEGIEGRVVLQVTISRLGNISDIEVKRGLGYGCDEEAIRLLKEGPKWNPATRDGLNVETKVRVRVKFELK